MNRFSGTQITTMVVAVCVAMIALPVGVMAATGSFVNIVDPVNSAAKARVNGVGGLWTTDVDPISKSQGRVVAGRQLVDGLARPALPTTPFAFGAQTFGSVNVLLGSGTVAVTDLMMSHENNDHSRLNVLVALHAGTSGGCESLGAELRKVFAYGFIPAAQVTSLHFETPIVGTASPVCLKITTGVNPGLFFGYQVSGFVA